MMAHGALLRKNGFSLEQLKAILADYHQAGLEPVEVALMDFARHLSLNPETTDRQEIQKLRDFGLDDAEILDVAFAAAARNFFSRLLGALGAEPDRSDREQEPELWEFVMNLPQRI